MVLTLTLTRTLFRSVLALQLDLASLVGSPSIHRGGVYTMHRLGFGLISRLTPSYRLECHARPPGIALGNPRGHVRVAARAPGSDGVVQSRVGLDQGFCIVTLVDVMLAP